jgi:hypothetical protein
VCPTIQEAPNHPGSYFLEDVFDEDGDIDEEKMEKIILKILSEEYQGQKGDGPRFVDHKVEKRGRHEYSSTASTVPKPKPLNACPVLSRFIRYLKNAIIAG